MFNFFRNFAQLRIFGRQQRLNASEWWFSCVLYTVPRLSCAYLCVS